MKTGDLQELATILRHQTAVAIRDWLREGTVDDATTLLGKTVSWKSTCNEADLVSSTYLSEILGEIGGGPPRSQQWHTAYRIDLIAYKCLADP